jgi:hypothetical protein
MMVCPEIAQNGLIGIPTCVSIGISYDSLFLGGSRRFFGWILGAKSASPLVGDQVDALFRLITQSETN